MMFSNHVCFELGQQACGSLENLMGRLIARKRLQHVGEGQSIASLPELGSELCEFENGHDDHFQLATKRYPTDATKTPHTPRPEDTPTR
jgi:hypothetical protein